MSTCLCTTVCESEVVFGSMSSCAEVESCCLGAGLYLLCGGVVVFVCVSSCEVEEWPRLAGVSHRVFQISAVVCARRLTSTTHLWELR